MRRHHTVAQPAGRLGENPLGHTFDPYGLEIPYPLRHTTLHSYGIGATAQPYLSELPTIGIQRPPIYIAPFHFKLTTLIARAFVLFHLRIVAQAQRAQVIQHIQICRIRNVRPRFDVISYLTAPTATSDRAAMSISSQAQQPQRLPMRRIVITNAVHTIAKLISTG